MPEMTGGNIVQLICSDKLDFKSKEIEFPTKTLDVQTNVHCCDLTDIGLQGSLDSD